MRRYQLVFEEGQAREIETLAREYGLTEQDVLEQLVALGLEQAQTDGTGSTVERTRLQE